MAAGGEHACHLVEEDRHADLNDQVQGAVREGEPLGVPIRNSTRPDYTAEPNSKSAEALSLLGSWAATPEEAETAQASDADSPSLTD